MAAHEPLTQDLTLVEEQILTVTPTAQQIIHSLLEQRNIPSYSLRVFVSGGGCSGLQYGMSFEESPRDFDIIVEEGGVRLVVDPTSLMYLQGATIDYVDSLMGGGFRIDNPNAVSSCGCGHSFRTKDGEATEASGGCSSCSN
jgi:iron-sulfur cluster assembly protein